MEDSLWQHITTVREQSPIVHNITNFVVMNNTANALLAVGASPIMAHAISEVKDVIAIAQSLVINIGTLNEDWVESMLLAADTAVALQKPWVLDPVGAGATPYRDEILLQLLSRKPSIIRGNASEIIALTHANKTKTKGVDNTSQSEDALSAAQSLSEEYGCVVCISGATDLITDGSQTVALKNGDPLMTKVTGLGCTATAIIGALAAVTKDTFAATVAAMALMGVAGESAAKKSDGPGSLQLNLLDELYNISEENFNRLVNLNRV